MATDPDPLLRRLGEELARAGVAAPTGGGGPVTAGEVADLPPAVQRYLAFMEVVGRPRVRSFRARFQGRFRLRPKLGWMPAEAWQYNAADPITRVFLMRLRFARVVPMIGADTYVDGHGRMLGKLFGRVTVQTYVLAALASGRHRLPPLRVEVDDQRGSGSTAAQELLTEEIPVDVAPVPGVTVEATLRAPRGPLATEVGARPRWIIIGPVAALGLALVIGLLLWRRRVRRAIELKVSAYDVAVATLAKLERRGAPEGDAVDAWYVELSAVIRQYLEGRYDIRAPELTTEEFMQVAARNPALTPAHRDLLAAFMRDADQVKFAGVRPSADEALAALRAARGFVDDTRYVGADAAPTPAQAVAA